MPRETLTRPEIAERYGVTQRAVTRWVDRHLNPDFPPVVGRRGHANVYDAAAVDDWVRPRLPKPLPEPTPGDPLLTAEQVAALADVEADTIAIDVHRGRFPAPDSEHDGEPVWRESTALDALRRRRTYLRRRT